MIHTSYGKNKLEPTTANTTLTIFTSNALALNGGVRMRMAAFSSPFPLLPLVPVPVPLGLAVSPKPCWALNAGVVYAGAMVAWAWFGASVALGIVAPRLAKETRLVLVELKSVAAIPTSLLIRSYTTYADRRKVSPRR